MKLKTLFAASVAVAVSLATGVQASAATLIGQTIDVSINIIGADDSGFYTLPVLAAPITISGPGDFSLTIPVFKQLTFMGFTTQSTQIDGDVIIGVSGDSISVEMRGQVQPFELESSFGGISGSIAWVADNATGVIPGVNLDLFSEFTPDTVNFGTYYLGYQPGTDVTQIETLAFGGAGVPEPASWALMLGGFGLLGVAVRGSRRWARIASV
jgi:hypothetical protein